MIRTVDYLKNYKLRSTGWVQDASDFENLYRFVSIFSSKSQYQQTILQKINNLIEEPLKTRFLKLLNERPIVLEYIDIVGTAPIGSRKLNTKCNGIGQASLKGQKREFQGDWPTDNFLRWSEILQFVIFDPEIEKYKITPDGELFVSLNNFEERKQLLKEKMMMYPPAVRILKLISEKPQNKFSLGEKLGFIGESGFTNITEQLFLEVYFSSDDKEKNQ